MTMLASSHKLDLTNFKLECGGSSAHSSNSTKSTLDDLHETKTPIGPPTSTLRSSTSRGSMDDELENSTASKLDHLPPEKQLGKLKRFMQTVFRFAENLASERESVKRLMVDLLNGVIPAEEFYLELRGTTKFPLKPFVVPFLEASLPLLRMSVTMPMKIENLETELFGPPPPPINNSYVLTKRSPIGQNVTPVDRKRRAFTISPDRDRSPSPKRGYFQNQRPLVSTNATSKSLHPPGTIVNGAGCLSLQNIFPNNLVPPPAVVGHAPPAAPMYKLTNATGAMPPALATVAGSSVTNGMCGLGALVNGPRTAEMTASGDASQTNVDLWTSQSDDWRNIETLFTTVTMTIERLRYSLLLYQQRARLSQLWNEKLYHHQRVHDSNVKIEEMQKRTDAVVQEVKRAAVAELQKAVHAAEQRALHIITAERAQMENLLRDTQVQEDSNETCSNCGRRASQTCGGCGKARYCGVFCQHKDWPRHRNMCTDTTDNRNCKDGECTTTDETRSLPSALITVKIESAKEPGGPKSV